MERYTRGSTPSPLSNAYFSDFNRESVQQSILSDIKYKTGYQLDRQNEFDLRNLMAAVYSDLLRDPNTDVRTQVSNMNNEVIKRATKTISSGMLQQLVYLRDISQNAVPLEMPVSTSTYGNKIPINNKIGFGNPY